MDEKAFWAMIDASAEEADDIDSQSSILQDRLNELSPNEIESFANHLQSQLARALLWDLWGAATVIHGFVSDDCFLYFRSWLVSRGRQFFECILGDPDSLAERAPQTNEMLTFEQLDLMPGETWAAMTGQPLEVFLDRTCRASNEPSGVRFSQRPEMLARRYPRLWSRFGLRPTGWFADMMTGDKLKVEQAMANGVPMSTQRFWDLIGLTLELEDNPRAQLSALHNVLSRSSVLEIEAFEAEFATQMERSYAWDLWGAAFVAHGGVSDDGFEYFRCWLISKGQDVFESVLANPDALADLLGAEVGCHPHTFEDRGCRLGDHIAPEAVTALEFELFAYVARSVWSAKTGRDFAEMPIVANMFYPGVKPFGSPFHDNPEWLASHYPKLWRRFGLRPFGSQESA